MQGLRAKPAYDVQACLEEQSAAKTLVQRNHTAQNSGGEGTPGTFKRTVRCPELKHAGKA